MNERTKPCLELAARAKDPLDLVMRYHQETKHHFSRYARSLGYLDWANQPDPFRRYEGTSLFALPRPKPEETPASPLYEDLYRAGAIESAPVSVRSLSRLFAHSLAISAWKQAGDVRWALRINPSSGNLHPTEAYLLIPALDGLASAPGLYHYAAKEHALELRAEWPQTSATRLMQRFPPGAFLIGLSSVIWRETWKYGERAFRYCQHDIGHAIGSMCIAARMLGWRVLLLDGLADDVIASLLGLDRDEDFKGVECEHPACIAVIWPVDQVVAPATGMTVRVPLSLPDEAVRDLTGLIWRGKAKRLSQDEPVQWEIIDQVATASWKPNTEQTSVELNCEPRANTTVDGLCRQGRQPSAAQVIRQRRSALAFDGASSISADSFITMLTRVVPGVERDLCRRFLTGDEERMAFVADFWSRRDPALRDVVQRRVAFADRTFGDEALRGSLSDRGTVFVLLGPPVRISMKPLTGQEGATPPRSRRLGFNGTVERWVYQQSQLPRGVPVSEVEFRFITEPGYGESVMQKDFWALKTLAAAKATKQGRAE